MLSGFGLTGGEGGRASGFGPLFCVRRCQGHCHWWRCLRRWLLPPKHRKKQVTRSRGGALILLCKTHLRHEAMQERRFFFSFRRERKWIYEAGRGVPPSLKRVINEQRQERLILSQWEHDPSASAASAWALPRQATLSLCLSVSHSLHDICKNVR